jgi:uncharacterized protein YbjT (DUF2867 family)
MERRIELGLDDPMTNHNRPSDLTLVLGGTGKTGRRVAQRLRDRGVPVRIGSRHGEPSFDWDDCGRWGEVLEGVNAAYIAYYPDLGFPGADEILGAFGQAAVRHGVERLVLLSGRGEEAAAVSEEAMRSAAPDLAVLRCSWFMQNFSEHFLLQPVRDGDIALPAGDVAEPFLDLLDLADVAVAVLSDDAHRGQVYELTGPRLLTFGDVTAELSRTTGRDISYTPVTPDEYAAAALAQGVPLEEVAPLTDLFTRVLDGRNAHTTDTVERILGRAARDFSDYAHAAAATGVWNPDRPR